MAKVVIKPRIAPSPLHWFTNGRHLAPIIALVILLSLVVFPLLVLVLASIRPAGVYPMDSGTFILSNYTRIFQDPNLRHMLLNTFLFAGGTLVFALPLAALFAFLTERTDLPFRNTIYVLMFIPMGTPVFATALGWVLLLGPRAGTINVWLRALTGSEAANGPFNVFSLQGLIFAGALGFAPSMWIFLISVLRNMDPSLEEAAATSGANRFSSLRRVTLPLMSPGIFAVGIYFFIIGIEALELPLALGITGGIEVVSTRIYRLVNSEEAGGVDYGLPAALGMLLLVIGILGISLYLYLVRRAARYTVVTGKGYRPRLIKLGKWKYLALGIFALYIFVKIVLPFSILVYTSFLRFYQPLFPDNVQYMKWTIDNYMALFDYRFLGRFFINTLVVSIASATVTMLLVSYLGWLVVRLPGPVTRAVNVLAFMPLGIPGTIATVALLLLLIGTPLYGTLALLVIAYVSRFVAFGTRLMHAAQLQIHKELEEVALTSGIGRVPAFFLINLRLLLPAFLNGWLYIVVHAAKDFSVPLFLASGGSLLFANVIFDRWVSGNFPQAAAMMVVLMVFNLIAVRLGRRWLVHSVGERGG